MCCVHVNILGWRVRAVRLLEASDTTLCEGSSQGHGPRHMSSTLTLDMQSHAHTYRSQKF